MVKRVAYYPGCSCEGMAIEYDRSVRVLCHALGIELVEIPDWNCCGSTPSHSYDPLLGAAMAGRNLSIARSHGFDMVMTPCPSCLKALKCANQVSEERPSEFRNVLGMPYAGDVRVVSILQLLYEEIGPDLIRKATKIPLKNKTIVPYYGCLLTRPPKFAQFDDPENPVSMDQLIAATGARVPDFPHKTECCGAALGVTQNDVVMRLTGRILDMARAVGADAVAVACPLCQQNLDLRQGQVNRALEQNFNLPVLYITQIIGYALGIDRKTLGIQKLVVNADALFQSA